MLIRKLKVEDVTQLAVLYAELDDRPINVEKMTTRLTRLSDDPDYLFLGAAGENGKLLGSVMGIICEDLTGDCQPFMVVENVIVTAAAHGQGIGMKLMSRLEEFARERNCHVMMLMSNVKREGAHRFYERLGFSREVGYGFVKDL
ncbi:GNAT family N-acetyltransferase [Paenibacillus profundus]|uniref:GNAT family N-acetyltransferase n=1 Tax=Paenibacillus profundus TaxID=1173085 RepID=A0ABS8YL99_9BACL|nr:GNAT family N-acetyltransferase [Paenibacillus profundus]MCE5171111.1 GNAT family N-acetyltransferase [Paenibacillus profundus]